MNDFKSGLVRVNLRQNRRMVLSKNKKKRKRKEKRKWDVQVIFLLVLLFQP